MMLTAIHDGIFTFTLWSAHHPREHLCQSGAYYFHMGLDWSADAPRVLWADESRDGVIWHAVDPARVRFTVPPRTLPEPDRDLPPRLDISW